MFSLLAFLIGAALVVIPFWIILPRTGLSKWWALAAMIPLGVVILLWVIALRDWSGGHDGSVFD